MDNVYYIMYIVNHNNFKNIIFSLPHKIESKSIDSVQVSTRYKIKTLTNENDELKKVVLISPKIEMNVVWSNLKYQSIKITLDPLVGNNLKFYNLMNDLEFMAFNELKRVFGDVNFKSVLSEVNHKGDLFLDDDGYNITILTLKILKNTTTFNHIGKKININSLDQTNGLYKYVIEFTELWYDNETNIGGCNFNIVQLKYYPQYYENDILVDESNVQTIPNQMVPLFKLGVPSAPPLPSGLILGPPPAPLLPLENKDTNITLNSINIISNKVINQSKSDNSPFVIDQNTLSNALSRLKKTS